MNKNYKELILGLTKINKGGVEPKFLNKNRRLKWSKKCLQDGTALYLR